MDQACEQQAGRFLLPFLPADSRAGNQDGNGEPLCWAESSGFPFTPAPQHGKEAKEIPFPTCCLLPLSEIRIN